MLDDIAELRNLLRDLASIEPYGRGIRVVTIHPFKVWDVLMGYCGDLVVLYAGREGLFFTVRLLCVERSVEIYLEVRRINRIFYLHPMLALFKDEAFSYT